MDLKSHTSKSLFVNFTHIYKYHIVIQLVYLDFLRLDCTALVTSVGEKGKTCSAEATFYCSAFQAIHKNQG